MLGFIYTIFMEFVRNIANRGPGDYPKVPFSDPWQPIMTDPSQFGEFKDPRAFDRLQIGKKAYGPYYNVLNVHPDAHRYYNPILGDKAIDHVQFRTYEQQVTEGIYNRQPQQLISLFRYNSTVPHKKSFAIKGTY